MRVLIATVLGFLALAAPASAKYLHMSEGKQAAQTFNELLARVVANHGSVIGNCWRANAHVVQCGMTQDAEYINGPSHYVVIIALRGDRLYGHARFLNPDGSTSDPEWKRYYVGRLGQ